MTSSPLFHCPLLLLLPISLLIQLGRVESSPGQHGSPADSDEVQYIPKQAPPPSTARPAKASRLPNILTSLEIPQAYLEEILRPDKPPQRLPPPPPPLSLTKTTASSTDCCTSHILHHSTTTTGGDPRTKAIRAPSSRSTVRINTTRAWVTRTRSAAEVSTTGQRYQDHKDRYDHYQDPRYHVEPPVSRRSREKTSSGGLYQGDNDVTYGSVEKTPPGPKAQWSWVSSQETTSEEEEEERPHSVPQEVGASGTGPRFDRSLPREVTVQAGKTAVLTCRVLDSSEKSVSWMRHEDLHILSVDQYKYSTDERLSVARQVERQEWTLTIQRVSVEDAGMYECQVSTKPVLSFIVNLQVVVPRAEVVNGPEIFVHRGSLINLTCVVTHGTQRPVYVYWYHHNKVLDYEGRGGVTVITKASSHTVSHLLMRAATPQDSGLYSCRPSNGEEATATLHVLNGEHQAAMQSDAGPKLLAPLIVIVLGVCLTHIVQPYMSNVDGAP
ncbi:LOW QUALITY PROTEIN: uncharacterized protein [Panulirus ornatus]|uniref:LOW QUALITY PROTEIN: uncharacterized protein n=1 Tax=Panulirus ornatus TaxID=150431 RepID=UPI003A84B062